jgi:hypothetical protein
MTIETTEALEAAISDHQDALRRRDEIRSTQPTGFVQCRIAQETGVVVTIYRNVGGREFDPDAPELNFWTVCEDHGTAFGHKGRPAARLASSSPSYWCMPCQDVAFDRAKAKEEAKARRIARRGQA